MRRMVDAVFAAVGREGKAEMSLYLPENTKTGDFNPQRTLSVSFFVIPGRFASIRAVVLVFTPNKQTTVCGWANLQPINNASHLRRDPNPSNKSVLQLLLHLRESPSCILFLVRERERDSLFPWHINLQSSNETSPHPGLCQFHVWQHTQ